MEGRNYCSKPYLSFLRSDSSNRITCPHVRKVAKRRKLPSICGVSSKPHVFVLSLRSLQLQPLDLKDVFCKFWVVQKSYNWFSTIPIDQAHEQENAKVKGNGGLVGLTENSAALCRWLLSCPKLARLLTQFEEQYLPVTNSETECTHHEEGLSHQMRFHNQVNKLVEEINGLGNPFEEQCQELVILNTRECADDSVVAKVCQIEELGEKQYKQYKKEVLEDRSKPIHATIKKNLLPFFSTTKRKTKATAKKIKAIRHDVGLFKRLYMGNQQRECDPDKVFPTKTIPIHCRCLCMENSVCALNQTY